MAGDRLSDYSHNEHYREGYAFAESQLGKASRDEREAAARIFADERERQPFGSPLWVAYLGVLTYLERRHETAQTA